LICEGSRYSERVRPTPCVDYSVMYTTAFQVLAERAQFFCVRKCVELLPHISVFLCACTFSAVCCSMRTLLGFKIRLGAVVKVPLLQQHLNLLRMSDKTVMIVCNSVTYISNYNDIIIFCIRMSAIWENSTHTHI
jgi:hypothetical protein